VEPVRRRPHAGLLPRFGVALRAVERRAVSKRSHGVPFLQGDSAPDWRIGQNCQRQIGRLWSEGDIALSERERVRLGAWPEEGDLQRALLDRVVLANELLQAAVP
jgi:hypothetical protein